MNAKPPSSFRTGSCSAKSWLLLDLALSFMFCVFAPLEAYFSNESEYWFRLPHLLPVLLIGFGAAFGVGALLFPLARRARLSDAFYALGLVALVTFYIQGNYIPRPYGVLNGDQIDWGSEAFRPLSTISLVLFTGGFVLWVCMVTLRTVKRHIVLVGGYVCAILLGIQSLSLLTLYLQNDVFGEGAGPELAVTSDKMLEFSRKNNVLLVLLDSFDAHFLNEILQGDEGDFARGVLRDFTYYPDTIGLYPTTKGALPHLLSGVVYSNEVPYGAYVAKAYRDNPLYRAFEEKGYSVGVYTVPRYVSPDPSPYENIQRRNYHVAAPLSFAKMLSRLVAFNYLPHRLKKGFVVSADDFLPFRKARASAPPFSNSVLDFHDRLMTMQPSLGDSDNVFRFYHLEGTHPPASYGKELRRGEQRGFTLIDESLGCLALLKEFFDALRGLGAYDSSTIIVLADHGYVQQRQSPIFLVKNKNESHEFRISDAAMSYGVWFDLLLPLVRDDVAVTEESIRRQVERRGQRNYLYYEWDNTWDRKYLPLIEEMRLFGSALLVDGSRLERTGIRFGESKNHQYTPGELLTFGKEGTAAAFFDKGFFCMKDYHWTQGNEAEISFVIKGDVRDYFLDMEHRTYTPRQPVTLYANGREVAKYVAQGREKRRVHIPFSCIKPDKTLVLRFELPGAISPDEVRHNGDKRQLALGFYALGLFAAPMDEVRGKTLSFVGADGAPARKRCLEGVGQPEKAFSWTVGDKLSMKFPVAPHPDKALSVTLRYGTLLPKERVIVSANGQTIATYVAKGDGKRKFMVPPTCFSDDGTVTLTFSFPDAVSPKELGQGGDDRKLALRLYSVTLK
jgi:hypothetical protein